MHDVFMALGTNIEPRIEHLMQAIDALGKYDEIEVIQLSSVYETKPVGYIDQADFLNMVIQLKTTLKPYELLKYSQQIEDKLGRERKVRFGPRSIDLDLLLFNNKTVDTEELTVPHPRMHERAFVLVPLKEISSGLVFRGYSVEQWVDQLSSDDLNDVRLYKKINLER